MTAAHVAGEARTAIERSAGADRTAEEVAEWWQSGRARGGVVTGRSSG